MNPVYPSSYQRGAAPFVIFKGCEVFFIACFLVFDCLRAAKNVGAGDRSRTYTGVSPEDFESSASAIPPLRHVNILGQDSPVGNFISELGIAFSKLKINDAPLERMKLVAPAVARRKVLPRFCR